MKTTITWFEIPVLDFEKQKKFYEELLQFEMKQSDMGGCLMGFIGDESSNICGAIVKNEFYKPSGDGVNIYFHTDCIEESLERIANAGGKVFVPKTLISPEIGYFAVFADPEGNRLSLHSKV